jgi:hypothetical protein
MPVHHNGRTHNGTANQLVRTCFEIRAQHLLMKSATANLISIYEKEGKSDSAEALK